MLSRRWLAIFLLLWISFSSAQFPCDTIGWTDRDRQFLGPAVRYLAYDTARGFHAIYKTGYGEIRYNFRPKNGNWRWDEGVTVNPYQRNLGCLDYDITNGRALIATDYLFKGRRLITLFIDSACGAGRFEETTIGPNLQFNLVAAARFGYPKFAAIRNESLYYYTQWSRRNLGPIGPFALHNIFASKISSRLGFVWTEYRTKKIYLRETPDGGGTWYGTRSLSDSVPSDCNRSLFGGCLTYDSVQPHLVCDLYDGENRGRVQLWHYCQYQEPNWSFITECTFADTSKLGFYTAALCRPSIGIDRRRFHSDFNRLYCVWEQFDPQNIDPRTNIARADIWAAASFDNGRTWTEPLRLTQPDEASKRFPYLAEVVDDTLHILYFADQEAGSWELGEGERRLNPVIYLRVPADIFIGQGINSPEEKNLSVAPGIPTILTGSFLNSLTGNFSLYDKSGRRVNLKNFERLPAGVYFLQIPTTSGQRVKPIVKPK
ncbi:MAG: T9SS type A sorting domain-containing protein [candidate division WOR-3 bacterium]